MSHWGDEFYWEKEKKSKIYSMRTFDNFYFGAYITLAVVTFYWLKMPRNEFACWINWFFFCKNYCMCVCVRFSLFFVLWIVCQMTRKKKLFFFHRHHSNAAVTVLVLTENRWNHKSNNSHQNLSHKIHSKYNHLHKIISLCIKEFLFCLGIFLFNRSDANEPCSARRS